MNDQQLTEHFTLFELTKTNFDRFQEENRNLSPFQIGKLTVLAKLLEHVRFILGEPLIIHSGYRCPKLNAAEHSTPASQHLLCEAADFVVQQDLGNAFRLLWRDIKDKGTNVGQLIHETTQRSFGTSSWIHISLGSPYRDPARCKQILRMNDGRFELLA